MNEEKIIESMAAADGEYLFELNDHDHDGWKPPVLPAYLHDDNPIDRMVRGLEEDDSYLYASTLCQILGIDNMLCDWSMDLNAKMLKATTAPKVEAYLRATGLWVSVCPQCNGTGLYLTDAQARYGDEPQPCSMCKEKGDE